MRIAYKYEAKDYAVNVPLVEIGGLLHDIGRSQTHEIEHASIGGKMARELGLPEPVACIIDRHIGAGIPDDEARAIGLPDGDYVPETLEEKIVAYADKIIEGNRIVDIQVYIDEIALKYGIHHPAIKRLHALHLEITSTVGKVYWTSF